jgi:excinuclease ABC subunit A
MPIDSPRAIHLRGVRTHNLKGLDLDLPLNRQIAVTGVSGSGKSSLAFDTIYAEGQRRYVETFSPYARQFLEKLDKPDADRIDGIPPAIAVGQSHGRHSGRSTVGTITEIHDALALLFARAGEVICRNCGSRVQPATPATVSAAIDALPPETRYEIAFPMDLRPESDRDALLSGLRAQGFTRIVLNGQALRLDDPGLVLPETGSVDIIVDRLVRARDAPARRLDSIESAFSRGLGRCRVIAGNEAWTFVRGWRCSRCGTEQIEPQPNLLRFNRALGACPNCEGFGRITELDLARIVPDPSRTIRQGAIAPWSIPAYRSHLDDLLTVAGAQGIPVDVPFARLDPSQVGRLVEGVPGTPFTGLDGFFRALERKSYRRHVRVLLGRWRKYQTCPACQGARLRPEALAVRIGGRNVAELSALPIREARAFLAGPASLGENPVAAGLLRQVNDRLRYLAEIGLDYLTLDRSARSLSAGELQRVVLTKALGSGLVNTLYVLDEPSVGLHPSNVGRLSTVLHELRDRGNTIVLVEHDAELIRGSDHAVDLGPGAGEAGGRILYQGPMSGFAAATGSATADYLDGRLRAAIPGSRRTGTGRRIELLGARANNLRSVDVSFPLGVVCAVTGVSGAGKSTLVEETLYPALRQAIQGDEAIGRTDAELRGAEGIEFVEFLDQSPLSRSARSNPVTYLKAFDEIRRTFAATHDARLRDYDAGRFSFNVEGGRCNTCRGDGYLSIDMQFLPDVLVRCPECRGTRYRPEVLEIKYRGRNIAEILDMTAREAFAFFRHRPKVQARLRPLMELGLDYLRLGQPSATLSGGEAQRLKLSGFLGRSQAALRRAGKLSQTLFLLDEPTAGLHPVDTLKLIHVLGALVERGNSLIVVTHSLEVMLSADWIIELGPEAGDEGGRIVAQGTPERVATAATATGAILAQALREPRAVVGGQ